MKPPHFREFVGDGDNTGNVTMTFRNGWCIATSAVVRINGERVDMTEEPVGTERAVDGFLLVRTETGVKARSAGRHAYR